MRQSACLVVNPITVNNYGFLLNCTFIHEFKLTHLGPNADTFIAAFQGEIKAAMP